ncbi:MAG: DUF1796 family putative cysteine peptidase [Candidatus Babeliaceae bacterium]
MLKKIFIYALFLLGSINIRAVTIISFGQVCSTASALREYGLRIAAYPFDWIISRFEGLYRAIDDDFKHFLQEDSLKARYDNHGVIDYYGFEFVHDFPTVQSDSILDDTIEQPIDENLLRDDWKDFIPAVHAKYHKRIERLKNVLQSSEKVYIVRHHGISKELAIQLRDLLRRKYPNLDFILVIVGNSESLKYDWNIPHIRNFYLDDTIIWNDPQQWKNIFKTLELEPLTHKNDDETFTCDGYNHCEQT